MAHTQGKWTVEGTYVSDVVVRDSSGKFICVATAWLFNRPSEEASANARLIAAAPDLLKACELLAEVAQGSVEYSDWPELQKAVNKAHKAIEKATTPPPVG